MNQEFVTALRGITGIVATLYDRISTLETQRMELLGILAGENVQPINAIAAQKAAAEIKALRALYDLDGSA